MIKVRVNVFVKEDGVSCIEDESLRSKIVSEGVDVILSRFFNLVKTLSSFRKDTTWYLTGESKKEAMERAVFGSGGMNKNANSLVCRDLMNSFPLVVKKIWNSFGDTILCKNYIQSDICNFSYSLVLYFEDEKQALPLISEMIRGIIVSISPKIITVETNNYSRNENYVFPDRLSVGWMFYTNNIYDENLAGLQNKTHTVTKAGEPIGTLFFSKQGFFDGSNSEDIKAANDLEIMLASHDILPTYRNIF